MGRAERVEDCPHRLPPTSAGDPAASRCGLLEQITGVEDVRPCHVGRDACEACCRSFPPSAEDPNPVVASLLYDLTSRIARQGGVAGCDHRRAEELSRWALDNIPSEEDCLEAPPDLIATAADSAPAPLDQIIPPPRHRSGPRVRTWAVGVTTAPRPVPTLAECLASLAGAGWDRPHLFVDGTVAIPEPYADLSRTVREPRVGAWPNYFLSLAGNQLLMREPDADAYLMAQDDAALRRAGRTRLPRAHPLAGEAAGARLALLLPGLHPAAPRLVHDRRRLDLGRDRVRLPPGGGPALPRRPRRRPSPPEPPPERPGRHRLADRPVGIGERRTRLLPDPQSRPAHRRRQHALERPPRPGESPGQLVRRPPMKIDLAKGRDDPPAVAAGGENEKLSGRNGPLDRLRIKPPARRTS